MANVTRTILFPAIWPLGTTAPASRRPWATLGLLTLNLGTLGLLFYQSTDLVALLALPFPSRPFQYLTYGFVQPNITFCMLNIILLWTFAPALECRLGPWRLLLLYLLTAAGGGAARQLLEPGSRDLLAGASTPIFGLVGATLVLFPRASVRFFVSLILILSPLFSRVLLIPVVLYALLYAGLEFLLVHLEAAIDPSVFLQRSSFSPAAHLGGLAAGALLGLALRRQPAPARAPIALPAAPLKPEPLDAAVVFQDPPAAPEIPDPTPVTQIDLRTPHSALRAWEIPDPATATQIDLRTPHSALRAWEKPAPAPVTQKAFAEVLASPPAHDLEPAMPEPGKNLRATPRDLTALFGNPEDSAVDGMIPAMNPKPQPAPDAAPASLFDDQISLPADQTGGDLLSAGFKEVRTMKNEELDPPPLVIPALGSLASHTDEASRPEIHERPAARDPYQFGAVNKAPAIEPDRIELNLEASEETGSQALALKDQTDWSELGGGRFSVILAPGRPLNLSPIIGIMAKTLGLSQKGAYQALLHRRGILAENLPLSEAGRVSEDFAQAGHPVLLVAMTSRLQFGEGLDLVTIQEHADRIVLTTVAQTITAAWSQIVFLAAGQVSLTPGMASRTVLDLFLIQPRHHLRLWENSFVHGPVAPRFRPTVEMIATRAGKAIHTHSLDRWWHGEKNALHEFSSMIEYEHYLRWHLMAHLAPTRMVGGD